MKRGKDISATFPGLYLVHQNIPGKQVGFHSHKEHILFIPLQGEIRIFLRDKDIVCGTGRMVYLPPGTEHSFDSSSLLGERIIALVSDSAWRKNEAGKFTPRTLPTLQLCKELLFYLLLNPKTKHPKAILSTILHTLSESMETQPESLDVEQLSMKISDPRLRKAYEGIALHFQSSLEMEELARNSGLSVRSLNRLFLNELGLTPKQVQVLFRVRKAEELFKPGKLSVTEVAFEVGYESLSQFIEVFRRTTGRLPSEYLH